MSDFPYEQFGNAFEENRRQQDNDWDDWLRHREERNTDRLRDKGGLGEGMLCQARVSSDCHGRASQTHHRKLRSQGGDDSPQNLLRVCVVCHDRIHRMGNQAYELGLLVRSWDDPAQIPFGEAA